MMSSKYAIGICLFALASASAIGLKAEEGIQKSELRAISVDLIGDRSVSAGDQAVLRAIWGDRFAEIYKQRAAVSANVGNPLIKSTTVFASFFDAPGGRVVLSATATPEVDCQSYSRIGLSPNLITCPMRIAIVQDSKVNVIKSEDSFAFSVGINDDGSYNNDDRLNQTSIEFSASNKTLSTKLFWGAVRTAEANGNSDDAIIQLKY